VMGLDCQKDIPHRQIIKDPRLHTRYSGG